MLAPLALALLTIAPTAQDAEDVVSPPPVLSVEARQFPVRAHFAKRTELRDYVGADGLVTDHPERMAELLGRRPR